MPTLPELPAYFTEALSNAKYAAHFTNDNELVLVVEYELTKSINEFQPTPSDLDSEQAYKEWLDGILTTLGSNPNSLPIFQLRPQDLQFWGFIEGLDGYWTKRSPTSRFDTLYINSHNVNSKGLILYSITEDEDRKQTPIAYGPISSLLQFEKLLRRVGWIGVSSEPL